MHFVFDTNTPSAPSAPLRQELFLLDALVIGLT